jgi:signal-transduction protein with cAMP-binding, CBS, and nucleotidyltransferase domain
MPMNFDEIDVFLQRFQFWNRFKSKAREEMMDNCSVRVFKEGEVIFNQGDASPNYFVILRGTVALTV